MAVKRPQPVPYVVAGGGKAESNSVCEKFINPDFFFENIRGAEIYNESSCTYN